MLREEGVDDIEDEEITRRRGNRPLHQLKAVSNLIVACPSKKSSVADLEFISPFENVHTRTWLTREIRSTLSTSIRSSTIHTFGWRMFQRR